MYLKGGILVKNELINKARQIGVDFPQILLPNNSIDLNKWSVVACDQYTSQPDYWSDVEKYVDSSQMINFDMAFTLKAI